jgi:hypothetical protein
VVDQHSNLPQGHLRSLLKTSPSTTPQPTPTQSQSLPHTFKPTLRPLTNSQPQTVRKSNNRKIRHPTRQWREPNRMQYHRCTNVATRTPAAEAPPPSPTPPNDLPQSPKPRNSLNFSSSHCHHPTPLSNKQLSNFQHHSGMHHNMPMSHYSTKKTILKKHNPKIRVEVSGV